VKTDCVNYTTMEDIPKGEQVLGVYIFSEWAPCYCFV
jgi:hypothetical protein